jgi:hypothetical protein
MRDPCYIKEAFYAALDELVARDLTLLAIGAHEAAICHRLAVYLESRFPTFHVDCEYNRLEFNTKNSTDGSLFRPDIIVHKRTIKTSNLLVVDAKCTTNTEKAKPSADSVMMIGDNDFNYTLGVFLVFHTKKSELRDPLALRISGFWLNEKGKKHDTINRSFPLSAEMLAMVEKRRR